MQIPVAVGQIPIRWSVRANLEAIEDALSRVAAGTLLVLPEASISGYDDSLSGLDTLDPAELAAAHRTVAGMAAEAGVHLFCGSLLRDEGRWWNAGMYFAPGRRPWVYRKINLAMHERQRLSAGCELPTVDLDLPSGQLTAGVQLCREIRFADQWRHLATRGAQLLCYLTYAANPTEPPGVWRAHLISRAAELQRYVLAANVASPDQHCPSMIISPRGVVLAESDVEPCLLERTIDLTTVRDNYLGQQRGDVTAVIPRQGQS